MHGGNNEFMHKSWLRTLWGARHDMDRQQDNLSFFGISLQTKYLARQLQLPLLVSFF
jgi:hypothetical protein